MYGSMVLSRVTLAPNGFADAGGADGPRTTHMKVSGVISKVQSGLTTVKTSWGSMTIASAVTPKELVAGEEVDMQVNENNTVIDMHRKGEAGHPHRYASGNLTYATSGKKAIKLWTPEGEPAFDVQSERYQLSPLAEHVAWITQINRPPLPATILLPPVSTRSRACHGTSTHQMHAMSRSVPGTRPTLPIAATVALWDRPSLWP